LRFECRKENPLFYKRLFHFLTPEINRYFKESLDKYWQEVQVHEGVRWVE